MTFFQKLLAFFEQLCYTIPVLHLTGEQVYVYTVNGIRRHIEAVIPGLTRNVTDLVTIECAKARVFAVNLANAPFFLNFG